MSAESPWSLEAEAAVLGAMLMEPDAITEVRSSLDAAHFFREGHRVLYAALTDLHDRGDPTDPVSVGDHLAADLERIGGYHYLMSLYTETVTAAQVGYHARLVREKAQLRALIDACKAIQSEAMSANGDASSVLRSAEERIMGVSQRQGSAEWMASGDAVMEAMEYIEAAGATEDGVMGLRTGFPWLDHLTGGLQDGDLTIIAARPGMGKSALGWQVAKNVAKGGDGVAIASYEMSERRLLHRGLAAEAGIDSHRLRAGKLEAAEYKLLAEAANRLGRIPIRIQYPPSRHIEGLRSDFRRLTRKFPARLLIVDYLQQMEGRGQNRNNQVEHISRGLKRLAADLKIPVVALAQLSRTVEHRNPPRPMLSDLRDSGAIEQDADNVLMLWRPEMYFDPNTPVETVGEWRDKGELIVAKQRDGETGRVVLNWHGPTTTFSEPETRLKEPWHEHH